MTSHDTLPQNREAQGLCRPEGQHSWAALLYEPSVSESLCAAMIEECRSALSIEPGTVRTAKLLRHTEQIDPDIWTGFVTTTLTDRHSHQLLSDCRLEMPAGTRYILISKRPGITDDEGMSAQRALHAYCKQPHSSGTQYLYTQSLYLFTSALDEQTLHRIGISILSNPLVEECQVGTWNGLPPPLPRAASIQRPSTQRYDLDLDDEQLMALSSERHLALDLTEMRAIKQHYAQQSGRRTLVGLPSSATDCELEVLGQTWSEHCKHKEFAAEIQFDHNGILETVDGLFKSRIRAATEQVRSRLKQVGQNWILKVFDDNAGVVRLNEQHLFVWKVETHNTPSALDPYGGAITGILGNNRDALGTGVGGARLLFNTNVLCFGPPNYSRPLLKGQLHPLRVMRGVVKGIMDGGNKSGVPTVNGSVHFADGYAGKPLVFCGTGGLLPHDYQQQRSWDKPITAKDLIAVVGGRVGKDGIHGATLSSGSIDASTPQSIVQIGSPYTQKLVGDFLADACSQGLVKTCTDNGAGGLASSVGELAQSTGGAEVDMAQVPLKYPGLACWEIFVSESQERMTVVVDPTQWEALVQLAATHDVELTQIGTFTDSGYLHVRYGTETVAYLQMDFLHNGVPRKQMEAEWEDPPITPATYPTDLDLTQALISIMGSPNVCSREPIIRRYDHEVQGLSVLKPLMGMHGTAPQDAAVVRLDHDRDDGLAISNGICPQYVELDPYHSAAGAFDEAVRQIVSVGGALPNPSSPEGPAWSVNDNFCVPNSLFHPTNNPDGKRKLGQLVRMCDALYDMATAYCIPLTSGKDSMKNDFVDGEHKISVPPTVLFSAAAYLPDVTRVISSEFKSAGDLIYLIGDTADELGGSALHNVLGIEGGAAPKVYPHTALYRYHLLHQIMQQGWISSCHDCSDGGVAAALAECCMGSGLGAEVSFETALSPESALFSESHSRFVVSITPQHQTVFEEIFEQDTHPLGRVTDRAQLRMGSSASCWIDVSVEQLTSAWKGGLSL